MNELIKSLPYWFQITLLCMPALSLFIAACAFVVNARQTVLNNKLDRAKIVSGCLHTFMDDNMMHNAFYKIEYDQFKYSDKFHKSNEEREVDKLLRHFSNIALMWKNNLLTLSDIYSIQYFILRTVNNTEIKKYLAYIEEWSKEAGTGGHPYDALNELSTMLNAKNNA